MTHHWEANLAKGRGKQNVRTTLREIEDRMAEVRQLAEDDPKRVAFELFQQLAVATTRMLDRWSRRGGEPTRNMMDAIRETRLATHEALELYQAQAAVAQADEFFDALESRLASAATRLEEGLRAYESPDSFTLAASRVVLDDAGDDEIEGAAVRAVGDRVPVGSEPPEGGGEGPADRVQLDVRS